MAGPSPSRLAARRRRFLAEWLAVSAIALLLLVGLTLGGAAARLDGLFYDALARATAAAPSEDIVVVAIDEPSLAALGRWPWPRERHVAFLRALAGARPRAVAYDVIFAEPDPADSGLAAALAGARPVFLPATVEVPGPDGLPALIRDPVQPLAAAAAGVGHVNLGFDPDGVARRAFLAEGDGRRTVPHLMAAVAGRAVGPLPAATGLARGEEALIPFHGPAGAYRQVPFSAVVRGEVPPEVFRGKLVLVGAVAAGLGDRYATPMREPGGMPGVEVMANLLQGIEAGTLVRPAPPAAGLAVGALALALMMAGCRRLSPRAALLLAAGLAVSLLAVSAAALVWLRLFVPPVAALVALAVVYPLWSWRRLEAASGYMLQELERFRDDDELGAAEPPPGPGDLVSRQLEAMDGAVGRLRDLRRFVADAVHALPDPTVVVGLDGAVLLANARAEALFGPARGRPWRALMQDWRLSDEAGGEAEAYAPTGEVYRLRTVAHEDGAGRPLYFITRLGDVTAARAATEQRERLLALLTHDMRSPQASILALLKTAPEGAVAPEVSRKIAASAERTLALADNFVLLARAQAETYDLQLVDLAEILVEAVDLLWPQSSLAGVPIEVQAEAAEELLVLGDRSLLTRALVNLIDNAVKYSERGGRVVCILARAGTSALCTIADRGRGMTPEELERIYRPFERGGDHRGGGAGLGLAMVRAVVQRHGGRLDHRSTPGEGVVAAISLPLAER